MTEEEKKELNSLAYTLHMHHIDTSPLFKMRDTIQKQQKEIEYINTSSEKYKEHNEFELRMTIKMLKNKLEKKDKIIDEMANYIIIHHQVKTMKKTFCENCTECEGMVRDCIKQYFEKKAEV